MSMALLAASSIAMAPPISTACLRKRRPAGIRSAKDTAAHWRLIGKPRYRGSGRLQRMVSSNTLHQAQFGEISVLDPRTSWRSRPGSRRAVVHYRGWGSFGTWGTDARDACAIALRPVAAA